MIVLAMVLVFGCAEDPIEEVPEEVGEETSEAPAE
jgi:hypothetical protein